MLFFKMKKSQKSYGSTIIVGNLLNTRKNHIWLVERQQIDDDDNNDDDDSSDDDNSNNSKRKWVHLKRKETTIDERLEKSFVKVIEFAENQRIEQPLVVELIDFQNRMLEQTASE